MATAIRNAPMTGEEKKVIFASSLGTVFEWYDFYLYGSLAVFIGKHFFSALDPASQMIFSLLAFAAGFIVRPFGALVFGVLARLLGAGRSWLFFLLALLRTRLFRKRGDRRLALQKPGCLELVQSR